MDERTRALLVVNLDVSEGWEDRVDEWYERDHIPEKLGIEGFLAAHRYRSVDRPRRFLTIYELSNATAADTRVPPTEWTQEIKKGWEAVERSVWILRPQEDNGDLR